MSNKLKPCPFCGYDGVDIWNESVYCKKCGCHTAEHATEGRAVEVWNTRADDKEVSKLKEQLAIAVDFIEKVYSDESDIAAAIQIPTGLVLRALQALTKIKDMECQKD